MTANPAQLRLDLTEGRRRRDVGKSRAASGHAEWLAEARRIGLGIARAKGTVNADDLRAAGVTAPDGASYNIWGSVFSGDDRFEDAGFVRSARPEAHANLLHQWQVRR